MQTRSAARKSAALAQAPPAAPKPVTKEEAPEAMVVQEWDPGPDEGEGRMEGIAVKPPRFNPIPVERSFNSLFYGSLSSISSSSSGGGSFSSVDDNDFAVSQEAAGALAPFAAAQYNNIPEAVPVPTTPHRHHSATGPTRVARGGSKRRLAKRPYPVAGALTSSSNSSLSLSSSSSSSMLASPARAPPRRDAAAMNWNSDPVYGPGASPAHTPIGGSGGGGRPRARTASASLDADDIFQRELQLLLRSKELALAGVKAVMGETKARRHGKRPPPSRAKPPSSSARRPLGPEGTELIDESFRAAPAGPSVYPQDWVAHPSNILHAHPTLPIIDDAKPSDAMVH